MRRLSRVSPAVRRGAGRGFLTMATAKLIGRTGPIAGKDFVLGDTTRIGSAREAEIRIRAEGVSRIHARLWREDDAYWLEDAGSTNGTLLSGTRVRKDRLRHLDVVTLDGPFASLGTEDHGPAHFADIPPSELVSHYVILSQVFRY